MLNIPRNWKRSMLMALGLILVAGIGHTALPPTAPQCFEVDNGSGTVDLPPANCQYMSPSAVHQVINGLPPGTTINLAPIHKNFICHSGGGSCATPGGTLGGDVETFNSNIVFQATGTGALSGWSRLITIPLAVETHTAPRTPGSPVQSFKTDMHRIQGQITGDPDFALLRIVGGTGNGFPSPGQTTLTRQSNGTWLVDSSFTVNISLEFVGASGGVLEGRSGRTLQKVGMKAYQ